MGGPPARVARRSPAATGTGRRSRTRDVGSGYKANSGSGPNTSGRLVAMNPGTGALRWRVDLPRSGSAPAVAPDGAIYVATTGAAPRSGGAGT
jgi:hypothetical protein